MLRYKLLIHQVCSEWYLAHAKTCWRQMSTCKIELVAVNHNFVQILYTSAGKKRVQTDPGPCLGSRGTGEENMGNVCMSCCENR